MSIKIQSKHSATKDKAPQPTDLVAGELALNIHQDSPAIYLKDSAGAVRKIAGVGSVGTPDASETVKGVVELATAAETTTGTDTTRAVHPAGLKVELDKKAPLASPALTGVPTAPTAAAGTNTTQVATTEFVTAAVAAEDLWDRTGTEITTKTAGDSVFTTGDVKVGGTTAAPNVELLSAGGVKAAGAIEWNVKGNVGQLAVWGTGEPLITSQSSFGIKPSSATFSTPTFLVNTTGEIHIGADGKLPADPATILPVGGGMYTKGDVFVGPNFGSPNIRLNANGTSSFQNSMAVLAPSGTAANVGLFGVSGLSNGFVVSYDGSAGVNYDFTGSGAPQMRFSSSDSLLKLGQNLNSSPALFTVNSVTGDVRIGGTLPASPNISLNADGTATFAGNVTAPNVTSDIRFKENLTPASSQLDDVKQLAALLKNWDWNDQAPMNDEIRAQRFLGLVAQEAETVCPHITYEVQRDEEAGGSYKALKHDVILMKLLGTVGELIAKNETLEAEVTALKGGAPVKDSGTGTHNR